MSESLAGYTDHFLRAPAILMDLSGLLSIPSMGGSEAETHAQEFVAALMREAGLEVHTWDMDLAQITADPKFPGQEVERVRGLGVLGIWRGTGGAPALLINGHTDVVPPGDPQIAIAGIYGVRGRVPTLQLRRELRLIVRRCRCALVSNWCQQPRAQQRGLLAPDGVEARRRGQVQGLPGRDEH